MKTTMFLAAAIAAGISVFADGSLRAYACNVAPFSNGERVAFLGDSITHGGLYHANLQLFWDLRFPGSGTCMVNCGISGDTAGGGAATLAMEAWKISREISSLQLRLRSLAMVEKVAAGHGAKADDFEDVCAKMDEYVGKLEKDGSKYAKYYSGQLAAYRRDKPQAGQLRAQEDDCRRRLADAAARKVAYAIGIRPSARQ